MRDKPYIYIGEAQSIEAVTSSHAGDLSQAAAPLRQHQGDLDGAMSVSFTIGIINLILSTTYFSLFT
jgi:hypothetical protein